MAFITADDYKSNIKPEHLAVIVNADDTVRELAETNAQATVESYLYGRYNTAVEFAKTGTARSALLVMWVVRCALYELQKRLPNFKQDEDIKSDYDDTIADLRLVVKGIKPLPLTPKKDTEGAEITRIQVSSVYESRKFE